MLSAIAAALSPDAEALLGPSALIVRGDSVRLLKRLPDECCDMIFADPPYNLGKDFGNGTDIWKNRDAYFSWCTGWIDECFRVLAGGGTFYLMNSTQNMPFLSVYIQRHYHRVADIVWTYDSSGVQPKRRFGSMYEPILMASKSAGATLQFNAGDILVPARTGASRHLIDYRRTPPAPYNDQKLPGNVWHFPRVRYRMAEYENHPAQKPEALLERVIRASSSPGDIVLDPFAGTFTTAAVAQRLGRRTIGIELSEEYYRIGLRRVLGMAEYRGEALAKDLSRKTSARSSRDHRDGGAGHA